LAVVCRRGASASQCAGPTRHAAEGPRGPQQQSRPRQNAGGSPATQDWKTNSNAASCEPESAKPSITTRTDTREDMGWSRGRYHDRPYPSCYSHGQRHVAEGAHCPVPRKRRHDRSGTAFQCGTRFSLHGPHLFVSSPFRPHPAHQGTLSRRPGPSFDGDEHGLPARRHPGGPGVRSSAGPAHGRFADPARVLPVIARACQRGRRSRSPPARPSPSSDRRLN